MNKKKKKKKKDAQGVNFGRIAMKKQRVYRTPLRSSGWEG